MLSNAYFVAKFRFDTAENEPAKNLQIFRKMHFSKMQAGAAPQRVVGADGRAARAEQARGAVRVASVDSRLDESDTNRISTEKTGTRRCSPNYSVEKEENPTLIVFGK